MPPTSDRDLLCRSRARAASGLGLAVLTIATVLDSASPASAATPDGFTPLEPTPRIPPSSLIDVNDMTPDGRVAVGNDTFSPHAVSWLEGVLSLLPRGGNFTRALAITPDASVVVGGTDVLYYPDALIWRDGGVQTLPRPDTPTPFAIANDVSAEGRVVVGTADFPAAVGERRTATRWIDGVIGTYPDPPGSPLSTEALFVSEDGSVAVGAAWFGGIGHVALRWSGAGVEVLSDPADGRSFQPTGISPDARVVIGYTNDGVTEAVRWEGGGLEYLGELPGGPVESRAVSVTDDASVVFGSSATGPSDGCHPSYACATEREPFVWTRATGMLRLEEWLRHGCDYDVVNWRLDVHRVSGSGNRLAVGTLAAGVYDPNNYLIDVDHCSFDYETPEWITGVGDYFFADYQENAIYRMHGETGEVERLTAFGEIYRPLDLEIGPDGSLYVLSGIWRQIVRVDPVTGEQTVVSRGGLLEYPDDITQAADGTLYAIMSQGFASSADRIVTVDPETGAQSLLSEGGWLDLSWGLARAESGSLLTVAHRDGAWWLVEIEPSTGQQSPLFEIPQGDRLAFDHRRGRLFARGSANGILAIDVETGDVSPVPEPAAAGAELEMGSGGDVLSVRYKTLVRIDPDTGEERILQSWGRLDAPSAIQEVRAGCSDDLDNDGDGLVDFADPGCLSEEDLDERNRTDVVIDISPWDSENRILFGSKKQVRVAVLGSDSTDVRGIDVDTLAFGPAGARDLGGTSHRPIRVDRDRHPDLLTSFRLGDTGIALGDSEACLVGTVDSVPFRSCDSVRPWLPPRCGEGFASAFILPVGIACYRLRRRQLLDR